MLRRNKTAQREYEITDRIEAGIVLSGPEVKSVKKRGINFDGAYVKIVGNEAMLINAHVEAYDFTPLEHLPTPSARE
ncbi:MAG: SsrA-binding protein, partial [Microgenomates bacterium OLB23]